jgi:hypothetical protein
MRISLSRYLVITAYVSFMKNLLTGPIPDFPGKVRFFDIGSNQMTGTLPEKISSHKHIRFLYLDNNKFKGSIPSDYDKMGSSGNGLSRVQEFWVNNNKLEGDLPTNWNKGMICKSTTRVVLIHRKYIQFFHKAQMSCLLIAKYILFQ